MSVWPDSPLGNPICVFFQGKVSLTVNPCLPFDRASLRFCWQPSSLLLGRICPRIQSYVVLPQAWASPYQCLHMLPPFGQDVASVAPFSGRLASLPLRQAVSLAISSSNVLSGPGGNQGYRICAGVVGRLQPLAWHLSVTHSLVNICMPQGCDGVQLVALSIGPLCRHDITRSDQQIGNV